MNVLIFTLGSLGDVHPFIGLGAALARRGHDVTVGANEAFAGVVSQAGLRHVTVGTREELEAAFAEEAFWHPYRCYQRVVQKVIVPAMRRQYQVIAEQPDLGDTVVVGSTVGMGARIAHDKLGVPLVGAHVQPMVVWSEHRSPVVGPLLLGDRVPRSLKRLQYRWAESHTVRRWMLEPANAFRAELNLPPLAEVDELLQAPQRILGFFPEWFASPQPDWPEQLELVGFPLWDDAEAVGADPRLESFLEQGAPPIVFTLSSTDWRAREFYATSAEACRLLGRRGILLSADPRKIPTVLPEGVVHLDYVPFRWLLTRVAALVHHGGLGTGAQAMAAAIPQVIRPSSFDQPDNAERLRRLGVSETLGCRDFRPRRLARTLRRLLASRPTAERCREIAARLRGEQQAQGLDRACEIVESLRGSGRAASPSAPAPAGRAVEQA